MASLPRLSLGRGRVLCCGPRRAPRRPAVVQGTRLPVGCRHLHGGGVWRPSGAACLGEGAGLSLGLGHMLRRPAQGPRRCPLLGHRQRLSAARRLARPAPQVAPASPLPRQPGRAGAQGSHASTLWSDALAAPRARLARAHPQAVCSLSGLRSAKTAPEPVQTQSPPHPFSTPPSTMHHSNLGAVPFSLSLASQLGPDRVYLETCPEALVGVTGIWMGLSSSPLHQ
mmetsp:Transcript_8200/g.19641  ORF Transcript_8200/g.19641 Transcript_8200/m.19641 type:complete len:226 (-) Transcript_8200:150-827(-)